MRVDGSFIIACAILGLILIICALQYISATLDVLELNEREMIIHFLKGLGSFFLMVALWYAFYQSYADRSLRLWIFALALGFTCWAIHYLLMIPVFGKLEAISLAKLSKIIEDEVHKAKEFSPLGRTLYIATTILYPAIGFEILGWILAAIYGGKTKIPNHAWAVFAAATCILWLVCWITSNSAFSGVNEETRQILWNRVAIKVAVLNFILIGAVITPYRFTNHPTSIAWPLIQIGLIIEIASSLGELIYFIQPDGHRASLYAYLSISGMVFLGMGFIKLGMTKRR